MSLHSASERTSAQYTATLQDALGVAIPLAVIVSAVLTLEDVATSTIINSRNAQNVLNANNVTIHATSGLLTWSIQPEDNPIVTSSEEYELHRAVFSVVYSGTQRTVHEVYVLVRNMSRTT